MFQNINAEYVDESKEDIQDNRTNIIEKLKDIFKIQNIIYYIACFGISMVGFGEEISPFGLAALAATCSNKMPAGIVYIACAIGVAAGQGRGGLITYILTSLVFITFSLIYPKVSIWFLSLIGQTLRW